jgi:hypothetical protein
MANCKFLSLRGASQVRRRVCFRAKGLSRLERPKLVKDREGDTSQLNRLRFLLHFVTHLRALFLCV